MNDTFAPNVDEYEAIKKIANSSNDGPVLMININKYLPNAGYPDGELVQGLHEGPCTYCLSNSGQGSFGIFQFWVNRWEPSPLMKYSEHGIPVIKAFWRLENNPDQMKVFAVVICA